MGILDVFKKKKEEDEYPLGQPVFQSQEQDFQGQGFNSQDPFSQQQANPGFSQQGFGQEPASPNPGFANQNQHQSNYSPEQMGFERVKERDYPRQNQSVADINLGKDMEIINAKLDAIKAELDSINQRIKRIERMTEGTGMPKKDPWY